MKLHVVAICSIPWCPRERLGSILGLGFRVDGFLQPAKKKMRDTDGGVLKLISEYSVFSDSSSALNLVFHLKENGLEKRSGF